MSAGSTHEAAGAGAALLSECVPSERDLSLDGFVLGHSPLTDQRGSIGPEAQLWERRDFLSKFDRFRKGSSARRQPIGKSDCHRLFSVHRSTGQEHVEGSGFADEPWQSNARAVRHGDTVPTAKEAKNGRVVYDSKITPNRQSEASGNRVAFDCGNHRFTQATAREASGLIGPRKRDALAAGQFFEIGPSAKTSAFTCQYCNVLFGIAVESAKCVPKQSDGLCVTCISHLRTIYLDGRDPTNLVDQYLRHRFANSILKIRVAVRHEATCEASEMT
jgi:hypothetical protein